MSSPSPLTVSAIVTAVLGLSWVVLGATPLPAWMLFCAGVFLGSAATLGVLGVFVLRPLYVAGRACELLAAGDISQSLQESGPAPLRSIARMFNTVLADFQEVLLLFAYFLRSAQTSIQVLREQADEPGAGNAVRSLCATTLDDLRAMQEMIEGFRYYRVRIESGTVTDTGVSIKGGEGSTESCPPSRAPEATSGPHV
jgi:hypothetical protein